jgi:nitrate reductase gamma subunit
MLPSFIVEAQFTQDWNSAPGCMVDGIPTLKCFEVVFGNVIFMASSLIVLVLFIMIFYGGFSYLTSFGNPEKVKKAQNILRYAIVGVILFMSSFLILKAVDYLFLGNCNRIFQLNIDANNTAPCP